MSEQMMAAGRYVVHHNGQTISDLTAADVAGLLESEQYADARVYRIHAVLPDGRIEMVGVPNERFHLEDGFFFYRRDAVAARIDFETLCRAGQATPPPCRAVVHLSELPGETTIHLVAMIYPAEFVDDMSRWLSDIAFSGGDSVEGGVSQVAAYNTAAKIMRLSFQLWGAADGTLVRQSDPQQAIGG